MRDCGSTWQDTANGRVLEGTYSGEVVFLSTATGAAVWRASAGEAVKAAPLPLGSRALVASHARRLSLYAPHVRRSPTPARPQVCGVCRRL